MKKTFNGTITALVTPFNRDKSVDIKVLKELVKFQIESGINGLVPCGSTGEAATLDLEEYKLIVKTVVKEAKGRVPVIAGAGSNDTKKALKLSTIAKAAGADALLHVTPYYNKPTPKGLLEHYKTIAKGVNMPIILYNVPGRTGQNVSPSLILKAAKEIPQILGVKEASGNITQMMDILKNRSVDFSVLSGDDSLTYPLIALGGNGIISVVSNEIPKQMAEMTKHALNKEFEKARQLHFEWLDLMNVNFVETNPIPVKTALAIMGKIKENFRLPLTQMEDHNRETLIKVLKKHNLI